MKIKEKINFILQHKTAIFLPIICFLHFLACFYYDFWIVATVFSVLLLVISDFSNMLYYMIFFQMFSASGKFSVITTFTFIALVGIKYLYGIISKKEKFYAGPFFITLLICVVYSSFAYQRDSLGVYQGWSLIAAFAIIYLIFTYKDKFKLRKCADFLVGGILASAFISLFILLVNDSNISIFSSIGASLKRIKLLTNNENSLAIYCSLALSYYVYAIINKQGNLFKNIVFGLSVIPFGLSTLSKCFLIICIIIFVYLILMIIIRYKTHALAFIIPIILMLAIIGVGFKSTVVATIQRFVTPYGDSIISSLTTGRSDLWTAYINEITSSIPKMLFGVGFFNARLVDRGPHNLLLHLAYRMGFVGIILIGVLIYLYQKNSSKPFKLTIKNCLPLITFLLISLVEGFL